MFDVLTLVPFQLIYCTVIWGYKFGDVAVAAAEDIAAVGKELQNNQTKRWQAVGMLKHVFSCAKLSWDLKRNALDFLLSIMDGCECHEAQDEEIDCSYMPSLHAGLLVICFFLMFSIVSISSLFPNI